MAFIDVSPTRSARGGQGTRAAVRVGIYATSLRRDKEGHPNSLAVVIRKDVLEKMRWQKEDRFDFLWGTDDDMGMLLVKSSPSGRYSGGKRESANQVVIRTVHYPKDGTDELHSNEEVAYQVSAGQLLIMLPDWFYKKQMSFDQVGRNGHVVKVDSAVNPSLVENLKAQQKGGRND